MTPRTRTRLNALERKKEPGEMKVVFLLDGVYYEKNPYSPYSKVLEGGRETVERWEEEGFQVLVVHYVQMGEPYADS